MQQLCLGTGTALSKFLPLELRYFCVCCMWQQQLTQFSAQLRIFPNKIAEDFSLCHLFRNNRRTLFSNGWLERLDREQRLHALRMLLETVPNINGLLRALLRDVFWKKTVREYKRWLARNGFADELCVLLELGGPVARWAAKIRRIFGGRD